MRFILAAVLLSFTSAMPATAAWRVAESAHFRVYAEMSPDALRRKVELLEDYRNLLGRFTTAQVEEGTPKLDIYIIDDIASAVPFGKIGSSVAGFYNANDSGIVAFSTKGDFGQKALLHEYAHHHMFAATGQSYPAWYVEGFAEYFMTAAFYPTRVEFGLFDAGRVYALQERWLSWDKVLGRDYHGMNGDDVQMFYPQSWLLTHYLFRKPEMKGKLSAMLRAISAGSEPLAAFKANVMEDPSKLTTVLQGYMGGRSFTFSRLTRPAPEPVTVTLSDMPASAQTMLMYYAWLDSRGAAADDRKAALAKVQAAAARWPGDALATRTLAMAELYWGDKAKAQTLIDSLLTAAPNDPGLLRLKAETLLAIDASANRSEARRLLVRAVKLAPDDWRAMHVYLHTNDIVHGELNDNLFNVTQAMWSLAPQVSGIVIDMATALARKNRLADAAKVLQPVAFAPHGDALSGFARALRDAALTGNQAAFVKAFDAGPPKEEKPTETKAK